ncbi:protein kinase [Streptomyces sp. NPDC057271]|uniref:serine/threonine-protein kinase n=1 Tax=unclassified Streptomyces TaxID=2593676 RepID=UPI003631F93D
MTGANGAELVGEVLGGRYRVTAMIGRGGMGVVARAVDQVLNREVAVKVLRAYTDASPAELADLRVRMEREAQAAARIRHSGVVTVHDVVEERGLPVIVMELVDGPSLDEVLTERGPLDPREVAAIGARLMDALDAAHRAGVLHRDVKPGNVLLERAGRSEKGLSPAGGWGRVVLTDFGIASMEHSGEEALAKLTQSGQLVGSLDYLPPERAQGRQPGSASDVWALGMTLYAAVEGASAFRRTSVWSTLAAIVGEQLPEPRRAGPLAPVLRALMAKDPEQRPDAARAREMLEAVAAGGTPTPPPGAVQTPVQAQLSAPVQTPVQTPVQAQPSAPVQAPVQAQLSAPVQTPVQAQPSAPVQTPVQAQPSAPVPDRHFAPLQAPAPGPAVPPGAFGPAATAPFQQSAPQPFQQPVPQPFPHPGIPGGPGSRADTATVRAGRRRTRTVLAAAVATVLIGGGVAYGLMNTENEPGGGSAAAPSTASAPADGDLSGGGPGDEGDGPTSPGNLTSMGPDGTSAGTPSGKGEESRPAPTTTGGGAEPSGKPSASPSPSAKPTPTPTVKEPTPVSTACTGWAHSNRSDGYGDMSQNSHLYTGPYSVCSYVTVIKTGTKVYYHCYVTNAQGNKWIYARIQGTETEGWLYSEKVTQNGGSLARC